MIIGLDVDGVLSNFIDSYTALLKERFGIDFPKAGKNWPACWYFDRAAGITKEQEKAVWKEIAQDDLFWFRESSQTGCIELLTNLSERQEHGKDSVYFITDRLGPTAKIQTEGWLRTRGFLWPTVLISREKALLAQALRLDIYIDDKTENIQTVVEACPATRVFRRVSPYNTPVIGAEDVSDLFEFRDRLLKT